MMKRLIAFGFLLTMSGLLLSPSVAQVNSQSDVYTDSAWIALQQGRAVALVRHALAPGTGDPANFSIDDCSTQRNLSEEGHQQSRQMGELFKNGGIAEASVFSSQWCRCMDTANGFGLTDVEPLPMLNSFFQDRSTAGQQTDDLKQWIVSRLDAANDKRSVPAILVSHQVNITGLTGVFPASGEIVIVGVDAGSPVVLGTFETR